MPAALELDVATTQVRIRMNKNEDFVLTIPVYDSSTPPKLVSLAGYTAVATVFGPGVTQPVLYQWSTTAGTLTCDAAGAHLTVSSAVTALWSWGAGEFELDITSAAGARGVVAAGPFTAVSRLVTP